MPAMSPNPGPEEAEFEAKAFTKGLSGCRVERKGI